MFIHPANIIPVPDGAPLVARIFALIMQGLNQAICQHMPADPAGAARLMLLRRRAGRLSQWLTRLALRLAEGRTPPAPRERPAPEVPATRPEPERRKPGLRLPHGHAWLIRLMPGEAAAYGSQLTHWLNQPETAALLAAAPHAGRRLRGLCRTLGVSWQNVTTLDLKPRPRLRPPRPKPAPDPAADPPAGPKPRHRRPARDRLPRPVAPAAAQPPAPPPGPPARLPAALAARLPEALRPRPPPEPGAAPDPGAYPRLGWASLFMLRKDL